jgi:protein-S-isoprenylcysteine O-methyltransferase Ste14
MVISRIFLLRKTGIKAMKFAETDKKDFLIPPFALFYFYIVFASAFNLPAPGKLLFKNEIIGWVGIILCVLGLILFMLGLISFGKSFRVGIDEDRPGTLVTTGVFAFSRNPLYTAFGLILTGIFLVLPNWILLIYLLQAYGFSIAKYFMRRCL